MGKPTGFMEYRRAEDATVPAAERIKNYNEFYDQWVATKSTYSYSLPVTNSSLLDQVWGAKIVSTSSSSKTFSPTMTIRYVAPDLP